MGDELDALGHVERAIEQLEDGEPGDNADDALAHLRAAREYLLTPEQV